MTSDEETEVESEESEPVVTESSEDERRSDRSEWESSDSEDEIAIRYGAPANLFELIDADGNNKVSVFEFFSMFVTMDSENDY